jgi:hypothetical protein
MKFTSRILEGLVVCGGSAEGRKGIGCEDTEADKKSPAVTPPGLRTAHDGCVTSAARGEPTRIVAIARCRALLSGSRCVGCRFDEDGAGVGRLEAIDCGAGKRAEVASGRKH